MGRQINYYMGYNDFLTVAQTALDCGCVIYRADHADERWSITSGNSTDMISEDHRSYYFHVPQAGDIVIEQRDCGDRFSDMSELCFIQAGFSVPDEKEHALYRNRLYVKTAMYDNVRPEAVDKVYNRLVRSVKKIAPLREIEYYCVNPMIDYKMKNKQYISDYCLSLSADGYKLG